MIKQYDVSNIKTLFFFDSDFDAINHRKTDRYTFGQLVAFNNVTALSFNDETHDFTIKADDFDYDLTAKGYIDVIKADQNKHDDFDDNERITNVAQITDFFMYANVDDIDHVETKYLPDPDNRNQIMQEVYLVAKNGNKHSVIGDDQDCEIYDADMLDDDWHDDLLADLKPLAEVNDKTESPVRTYKIVGNDLVRTDNK